ncbi:MAG: ABC transporter permease [Bdellovibrionales bacterium]|nr:ABC transporter permease [Bdellovibrionales bacterium]
MKALHQKTIRNLISLRAQTAATGILVMFGVSSLVSTWSAYESLKSARDRYYQSHQLGDVFSEYKMVPESIERKIRGVPGVERAEFRISIQGLIRTDDLAIARFLSIPSGKNPEVNRLHLREGRLPEFRDELEIALHEGFAKAYSLHPGDALTIQIEGKRERVRIAGIAISPEFVYAIGPGVPLSDDRHFAVVWMPKKHLERLASMQDSFNSLALTVRDPKMIESVKGSVDWLTRDYGVRASFGRDQLSSARLVDQEIAQQKASAIITPLVFLGISAFLIHVIFARLLGIQRPEIALLKALGYPDRRITSHYLEMVVLMILIGAIPGIGMGAFFGGMMARSYARFFRFPVFGFELHPPSVAVGVLVALASGMLGAFLSLREISRLPPTQAMRAPIPRAVRSRVLLGSKVSAFLSMRARMVLRNLFSKPLRLAFTVFGISMASAVMVLALSWGDITDYMILTQFQRIQREDLDVTFRKMVSGSALQSIRNFSGVLDLEGVLRIPVRFRIAGFSKEAVISGWPEKLHLRKLLNGKLQDLTLPARGVLLSEAFFKKGGVRVGDLVYADRIDPPFDRLALRVAGFSGDVIGIGAHLRMSELEEALTESRGVNGALLKIDPHELESLYRKLKDLPLVATILRKDSVYYGFKHTLAAMIRTGTTLITFFGLGIAFGVIYNSIRVSFSERSRDIASLRVLGLSEKKAFRILIAEVALQTAIALPMGCLLGVGLTNWMMTSVNTEDFTFPVVIDRSTFLYAVILVIPAFFFSVWSVRRLARKESILDSLKIRDTG